MSEFAIKVDHLTVQFEDFKAVNNVSFTVNQGEIFGFLGSNGAGKTTTIRVLCGLLTPTEGEVEVDGVNFKTDNGQSIKSKIGYMSQRFTLYNDLSIEENLKFAASLRKLDKKTYAERKEALFKLISVDRETSAKVADLPSGVKQQISLVAALLHDPQIIFLDEPTAGVTPASRALFWKLIQKIIEQKKTVFVTTHHLDEAENCHRVGLMRDGELVALDTPQNLKKQTFPLPMYEFEPHQQISFSEILKFQTHPDFSFFEPYGLRFHAAFKSQENFESLRSELEKQFQIHEITPSLEDVFIKIVEKKK